MVFEVFAHLCTVIVTLDVTCSVTCIRCILPAAYCCGGNKYSSKWPCCIFPGPQSRPRFQDSLRCVLFFEMKLMWLSETFSLSVKPCSKSSRRKCRKNIFNCRDSTDTTFRTKSQQFQKQIKQDISHAALCAYLCTTWLPSHHVPFCDQGSGSHVLGRCLSRKQVDSPRMSPKTASGFIDQGFIFRRNCHEMFWTRLTTFHQSWHGDGIVFPILGPLQHRQPDTKARTSSTQNQPLKKKTNNRNPRVILHDTCSHLFTLYVSSDSLPRHKSCCWPSSPTAFTSSPANLCGVTTNHGYSRLNGHKGLYEWMTIGPTSIAHLPSPLEPSLS